jgi:succinyl-CoA synthetase beta subunit
MMLLEHDAKELLAICGLPIPRGLLAASVAEARAVPLPCVIKAQVPVGGRGKAGGILFAATPEQRDAAICAILGMTIKGHAVKAVRIEQPIDFVAETYISFAVDAGAANIRVLISPEGGVDIEDEPHRDQLLSGTAEADLDSVCKIVDELTKRLPASLRESVRVAGHLLASAFFRYEALLLEINPLFIRADGSWIIGDAKFVADDNAFERCPEVRGRVAAQSALYAQMALKLDQGYDFVQLDPLGDIGLVTTGAGLSMQLIDELVKRGHSPFNFCDIRTGEFRGRPDRLIQVLRWIAEGPGIRAVLVNFFAGLTDLGEIAGLLLQALAAVPEITVPVTARLIGNNFDEAVRVIAKAGMPITVETDLEQAIDLVIASMTAPQTAHAS